MSHLADRAVTCLFYGETGPGFVLSSAPRRHKDEGADPEFGCADCLKEGRFGFWHDTDIGLLLDETRLTQMYDGAALPPPAFPASALIELYRTPQIVTWQQELWLTCCNDFMAYLGTWEPEDFVRASPTGDGRSLFLGMTRDSALRHLWDQSLEAGETTPRGWHAVYYAFQCLHCEGLAGNWDCDLSRRSQRSRYQQGSDLPPSVVTSDT